MIRDLIDNFRNTAPAVNQKFFRSREMRQVPATLSQSKNRCISVFSGHTILLSIVSELKQ